MIYAVGEIILVVIGILIALQINNWNETRKQQATEIQLLVNLQGELYDNLQDLDSVAVEVDKVIHSLEGIFDLFAPNPAALPKDSLNTWLSNALQSPNWKPSEYLLNGLNNSGNIAGIRNNRLKLLLFKWARQHNEMVEIQLRTEKTSEEIITYLKANGSLRNVDVANPDFPYRKSFLLADNRVFLSDFQFENHIDDKLYMYKITRNWMTTARQSLQSLIRETEKSIEGRD